MEVISKDKGYRLQGQRYVTDQINAICRDENLTLTKPPVWDKSGWIQHDASCHAVELCTHNASESLNIDDVAVVECGKRNPLSDVVVAEIRKICRSLKAKSDVS